MVRIIGTLGKYDQRRLWKLICIVNPFDLYLKKSQKSNLSLDNKNLKWGEISLWNKGFFLITHWPQLTAPFYSILFETSICQFNSSKFSPIIPDEVREHLTRDQIKSNQITFYCHIITAHVPWWVKFFFFVINNFYFLFFHTQHNRISKIKQNKTADTYSTSQGSIKREGEREGQQEHKSHSFK